jgi:phosphoserine phosphatase
VITAVATVTAALGAVALTGHYNDRTNRRDQRRADYAKLVQAAGDVLDHYRQVLRTELSTLDDPTVAELNRRTDALLGELHRAAAVVEMAGSRTAQSHAKRIYEMAQGAVAAHRERGRGGLESTVISGAGDLAFEKEIGAFIDAMRHEIMPRRRNPFLPAPPP